MVVLLAGLEVSANFEISLGLIAKKTCVISRTYIIHRYSCVIGKEGLADVWDQNENLMAA